MSFDPIHVKAIRGMSESSFNRWLAARSGILNQEWWNYFVSIFDATR